MEPQRRALVIAIDGPAGAGKSTVARAVAAKLGYLYLDSGAMYRAFTVKVLRLGIEPHDEEQVARLVANADIDQQPGELGQPNRVFLDGMDVTQEIRDPQVSRAVPVVARNPAVRAGLVAAQRRLAARGGVVMDGRDIGTVVLPQADVKIFLTASLEERARRRHMELAAKGIATDLEALKREIRCRDSADTNRAVSPLVQAPDAVLIDTTDMPVSMAVERVLAICAAKLGATVPGEGGSS